jgi:HSP20 family protein
MHLARLHGQLNDIMCQLARIQFFRYCRPTTWSPAINAYRCDGHVMICVDLAGVDRSAIDLTVETRQVRLRGRREAPDPCQDGYQTQQVLYMEIDYGTFERTIELTADVDTGQVRAEQRNGLLWIYLPLRSEG